MLIIGVGSNPTPSLEVQKRPERKSVLSPLSSFDPSGTVAQWESIRLARDRLWVRVPPFPPEGEFPHVKHSRSWTDGIPEHPRQKYKSFLRVGVHGLPPKKTMGNTSPASSQSRSVGRSGQVTLTFQVKPYQPCSHPLSAVLFFGPIFQAVQVDICAPQIHLRFYRHWVAGDR